MAQKPTSHPISSQAKQAFFKEFISFLRVRTETGV
jgi:hypothetical protein